MNDDTTTPPHDAGLPRDPDDAAALLASMRAQLEEATADLDRLTTELEDRSRALAEAETVADAVLGVTDTVLVVVGPDRRVRALSRGAAELAGGADPHVGRPLSAVLPDDVAEVVAERLDASEADGGGPGSHSGDEAVLASGRLAIDLLEGGGAVLILRTA